MEEKITLAMIAEKQLAQLKASSEKATELLYEKEKRSTEFLGKTIKGYFTLELIKHSEGVFWALPSPYPEDKNPDVVGIIEVRLSNWKILNALKDIETNKLYFSETDMDLILNSLLYY